MWVQTAQEVAQFPRSDFLSDFSGLRAEKNIRPYLYTIHAQDIMPQFLSDYLFTREKELFKVCKENGTPLPFSLSSLRKDRLDQRLGGLPYRRQGGTVLYSPNEVVEFISNLPIIQGQFFTLTQTSKKSKPSKSESVQAARNGLTLANFRAKEMVKK